MKTFAPTATSCHPLDYILKSNAFHKKRFQGKMGRGRRHESIVDIPKRKTLSVPSLNRHILILGIKYNLLQKYKLWMS